MFAKSFPMLFAGLVLAATTTVHATIVNIDFNIYAVQSTVTTEIPGVAFSLMGGTDPSGFPTIIEEYSNALSNSNSGYYPTASILNATFSGLASRVSFSFNPLGYCGCSNGRGDTYYEAFGSTGNLLETGKLGAVTNGDVGTFTLLSSGIKTLQFNNGTKGSRDWIFGLNTLSATVTEVSAVPEPETYVMLLSGLALLGSVARRSGKKVIRDGTRKYAA